MDELAVVINEEIVIQTGETIYEPEHAKYFRFISKEEMGKFYNNARIIVCHSGVGSILTALEYGKTVIVVPRLKIYGEHIDDHQLEIAREFQTRKKITVVYDIEELFSVLNNVKDTYNNFDQKNELVINLRKYLCTLNIKK
jgi:UDP-N-acetylglucosamine transferase subunit ALG13